MFTLSLTSCMSLDQPVSPSGPQSHFLYFKTLPTKRQGLFDLLTAMYLVPRTIPGTQGMCSLHGALLNEWVNLLARDKTNIHVRIGEGIKDHICGSVYILTKAVWKWFLLFLQSSLLSYFLPFSDLWILCTCLEFDQVVMCINLET